MAKVSEQDLEDLTLLLLYLNSWEEKIKTPREDVKIRRAWKGMLFEVLDKLEEKEFLRSSRGSKSVYLTDEGIKKAERLKEKFLGVA